MASDDEALAAINFIILHKRNLEKKREVHHKVGLGETPRRLIQKRYRYSSRNKFEDAFDTAFGLNLMKIKPSDAAFTTVFRTSINANWK